MHISQEHLDKLLADGLTVSGPLSSHVSGNQYGSSINTGHIVLISVLGSPVGKPRMTQRDKWKKRPCVVRYREWCDRVRDVAGMVPDPSEIAAVSLTAHFEPPKSWSKKRRMAAIGTGHCTRPDLDNICKGLFDCLWKEDCAIHTVTMRKVWGWTPKTEIEIVLTK